MAKKVAMAKTCGCGAPWFGWLVLIVGVLYLLADLGVFQMKLAWYSVLFLLAGIYMLTE